MPWAVIGQEAAINTLRYSLEQGRLAHAYLFVGPPHVGKGTLALGLAQAVNCQSLSRPCGECVQCNRIASGTHADVQWVVLELEGGRPRRDIGIDRIRELQRQASLHPYEGASRVFIVDGAEHLSNEAANCLLKTLEEPPPQVLLVLLTAEEDRLLPTLRSRCQRIELRPVPEAQVVAFLAGRGVEEARAKLLARLSRGCPGWALRALEDPGVLEEQSRKLERLMELPQQGIWERFTFAATLAGRFAEDRDEVQGTLDLWSGWWRDLLLARVGLWEQVVNLDRRSELKEEASFFSLGQIVDFLKEVRATRGYLRANVNPRLALEALMLELPARGEERLSKKR